MGRVSLFHLFPLRACCAIRFKDVAIHLFLSTQCGLKRSFIPFSTHLIYVLLNSSRTNLPTYYITAHIHTRETLTTTQIRRRLNLEYFDGP